MAPDRQFIEKKDFPIGRRGYDPGAVDEHLRGLANRIEQQEALLLATQAQIDDLEQPLQAEPQSLAAAASEHVQTIIAAAEMSASEMRRSAAEEAAETRRRAAEEAQRSRQQAASEAREHVSRVGDAVAAMSERIEATERELATVLDALRTGTGRVRADLTRLESEVGALRDGARSEEDAPQEPVEIAQQPQKVTARYLPDRGDLDTDPGLAADSPPIQEDEPLPEGDQDVDTGPTSDDEEGARLVALDMALNGTPREETDAYLAAHYSVADRSALLDDVYASLD
ncbi:MAG: DivIVA domain-containing protein [Actinomycetota bacterium]